MVGGPGCSNSSPHPPTRTLRPLLQHTGWVDELITASVSGDGGRDDMLHAILVARGWRSDRRDLPEEGDRFEWLPSIPPPGATTTDGAAPFGTARFGTTIYVETHGYAAYGPQCGDSPVPPRAVYVTRAALLDHLAWIETWR